MRFLGGALWALFALFLLVSGYVVLNACGTWLASMNFCQPSARVTLARLEDANRALIRERDDALSRINQAAQCEIVEPVDFSQCQPPQADETLVLVDVSGSMDYDYALDPALEAQLDEVTRRYLGATGIRRQQIGDELTRLERQADNPGVANRIEVAQQALGPLASSLPPSALIRLLSFAECGIPVQNEGTFTRDEAARYEAAVSRLRLRGNTDLANAISQLPAQTEAGRDEDRPINIVILSDGRDGCDGDPCAAAARLKQQLPYASVSVVSLATAATVNRCIADATGGEFLQADDVDGLMQVMRRSVGQLSEDECRAVIADRAAQGQSRPQTEEPQ